MEEKIKIITYRGKDGERGPKGDKGDSIVGPQGPMGPQGEKGDPGVDGVSIVGPMGPQGESIMGPQGPIGLTGATGLTGPVGLTGATGPAGTNGLDGKDGKDAVIPIELLNLPDRVTTLEQQPIGNVYGGVSKNYVQKLIDDAIGGIVIGPTALEVTLSGGSTNNEIGSVVNSVNLTWAYNGADVDVDTSQSLDNGIGSLPLTDRSFNFTTPISTNTTFTITGVDSERGTDTDSTSVNFNYRVYWGNFAPDNNLTEANVEGLSNNEIRGDYIKTFTGVGGVGERFVFAYPKSYGLATVRDGNNFLFQDWYNNGVAQTTPYEVTITNSFGVTADYYVYQTFNIFFGLVTFSFGAS